MLELLMIERKDGGREYRYRRVDRKGIWKEN
jgi:hypothetical protein